MTHLVEGAQIGAMEFANFEDVLGLGHSKGFTSLLIPGAGEANFDALELNPFESKRQKQENEVKMLLNKVRVISIGDWIISTAKIFVPF